MKEDAKFRALKGSPLAKEMNDGECRVMADLIDLHELKDGEVLVDENQTDRNLYVVVSGIVTVARRDAEGNWNVLHQLGQGDFVNELGFMDDTPHYAALRAQGETRVFSLNRGRFELMLTSQPVIVYKTMRAIMRTVHAIQRRMSMHMLELTNYIYKTHGKY